MSPAKIDMNLNKKASQTNVDVIGTRVCVLQCLEFLIDNIIGCIFIRLL